MPISLVNNNYLIARLLFEPAWLTSYLDQDGLALPMALAGRF